MPKRKSLSKKLRFEVFRRDGFMCRYCGNRPPEVALEVDHINPVARGGDNDPLNLVSSCVDCNRGKKARVLTEFAPRPDADMAYMELQQEIAEAERYLGAKRSRDEAFARVYRALMEVWSDAISAKDWPREAVVKSWLARYPAEDVESAIIATGSKWLSGSLRNFSDVIRYVWGVLKNQDRASEHSDPARVALASVMREIASLDLNGEALANLADDIRAYHDETSVLLSEAWFGIAVSEAFDSIRLANARRRTDSCAACSRSFEAVAHDHIRSHVMQVGCEVCREVLGFYLVNNTEAIDSRDESADGDARLLCIDCAHEAKRGGDA